MSDEREKAQKRSEEPDVEAHKAQKASDEKTSDDSETPDVEAHKLLHKVIK